MKLGNLKLIPVLVLIVVTSSCQDKQSSKQEDQGSRPATAKAVPATPLQESPAPVAPTQAAEDTKPSTSTTPSAVPTINPTAKAMMELNRLANEYKKEDSDLAKLMNDRQAKIVENQAIVDKKISALSPRGKELVEQEAKLKQELLASNEKLRSANPQERVEIGKQQQSLREQLPALMKEKSALSKQVMSDPETKAAMKANLDKINEYSQEIRKRVTEIAAKKGVDTAALPAPVVNK